MGFFKKKPENKAESHAQNSIVLDGMMQYCFDTQANAAVKMIEVRDMMLAECSGIDKDIAELTETKRRLEESIRLINASVIGGGCSDEACTCEHCSCEE